jgi:hypothetical protein
MTGAWFDTGKDLILVGFAFVRGKFDAQCFGLFASMTACCARSVSTYSETFVEVCC